MLRSQTEDRREVHVDDAAVADNGDAPAGVGRDDLLDPGDHALPEGDGVDVTAHGLTAHEGLPAFVFGGAQLLDRYVRGRLLVPLGEESADVNVDTCRQRA